ncbi:hypothetical protein LXL04_022071 [Taraxacum kok-saghyz]
MSNSFIEGCSHKIRRQIEDLEKVSGILASSLMVDGVPVDSYLTKFVWDEAKYPTMSPLKEIVDGIHVQVAKIYDDLKGRISEYNNVRSQLNTINKKQTGRFFKESSEEEREHDEMFMEYQTIGFEPGFSNSHVNYTNIRLHHIE